MITFDNPLGLAIGDLVTISRVSSIGYTQGYQHDDANWCEVPPGTQTQIAGSSLHSVRVGTKTVDMWLYETRPSMSSPIMLVHPEDILQ
jgi:hypothetical protein